MSFYLQLQGVHLSYERFVSSFSGRQKGQGFASAASQATSFQNNQYAMVTCFGWAHPEPQNTHSLHCVRHSFTHCDISCTGLNRRFFCTLPGGCSILGPFALSTYTLMSDHSCNWGFLHCYLQPPIPYTLHPFLLLVGVTSSCWSVS